MLTRVFASRCFGNALVEVALGDITEQDGFEAVAHPTNSRMALDGRVGYAIQRKVDAAALVEACLKLAPLDKSLAVLTPGFGLLSPNIIHCRGPRQGEPDASDGLRATYRNILDMAEESGLESVAIPAVSAGSKGFTSKQSAFSAIEAVRDLSPSYSDLKRIRFVLSEQESVASFSEALAAQPIISVERVCIRLPNEYSTADFRAMRQGCFGDHDHKWFVYYEEPWLLIYRGNRELGGLCFALRLPDDQEHSGRMEEAWAESWILEALEWDQGQAEDFVQEFLDSAFGLLHMVEDKESVSGVTLWTNYGKLVLGCPGGEIVMSPEEAGLLGVRLVEMSRKLGDREVS